MWLEPRLFYPRALRAQARGGARAHGPPPAGKQHGLYVGDVGDGVSPCRNVKYTVSAPQGTPPASPPELGPLSTFRTCGYSWMPPQRPRVNVNEESPPRRDDREQVSGDQPSLHKLVSPASEHSTQWTTSPSVDSVPRHGTDPEAHLLD